MSRFHVPRTRARPAAFAVLTAIASCVTLALATVPASAITVSGTPSPVTGNATWFTALGSPYGGCGLPQDQLDSQNFLALNVQNSPGNYSNLPRPIPAADASEIGMWDNGLNCGRWVQVTVSDFCNGTNDGAPNMAFCRNGSYVPDQFNGATLNFIVGDSCDDGNAWCKDDPFHIDLAQASLNNFVLNGQPVGNMFPDHWNNRHVTWQFIPAPNYTGDIKIGAIQGAQPFWPAIAVSHLANGIHSVQFFANGSWVNAQMDADMGDDYIIAPTTGAGTGGSQFEIRVTDSNDQLINNGRVYSFSLPSSCTNGCGPAYTPITYTTSAGPSPTPTPTTSSPPPTTTPPTTPPAGGGSCKLTSSVVTSWQGGFQLNLTIANTGSTASTGWSAGFSFGDSAESVANFWNSTVTQSATQVSATNVGFNGAIPAGGSTSFGMIVNGNTQGLSGLTCSLR